MSDFLLNASLVIKQEKETPTIEVDSDKISGEYGFGGWQFLIPPFTARWVKQKKFAKAATVWTRSGPSYSFGHTSFSDFIVQFGLPLSYFGALKQHLEEHVGASVRFSDHVRAKLADGWCSQIHVQDTETWIPGDTLGWVKVDV